jgi:[acyl-carrier-protein] S-malonyltransferase
MLFPGQGSQSPGMQSDLAERFHVVTATYAEASEVLGYDLWTTVQSGPAEKLAETTITQPAMLAAGVAAWRVWHEAGGAQPQQLSGHSLGEYSALVCAGALDFAEAVSIVQQRATLMQEAVPVGAGAMAAILGLDDALVAEVCDAVAGVVEPVNFNSPGQVVIAGEAGAVGAAVELAKEKGARRALLLPVSVPSHSSLMRGAGEALAETLASAAVRTPEITVVSAATATPYRDADDIRRLLSVQVFSPVRWTATIEAMAAAGANPLVECGPGKVLAALVRRIDKSLSVATLDDCDGLDKALAL